MPEHAVAATVGFLCLATALSSVAGHAAGAESVQRFWVATDGDDANPGSERAPFASLERAVGELARIARVAKPAAIEIVLRPGTYRIERPLRIGAAGMPSGGSVQLLIRAEQPGSAVISGGRLIGGWRVAADGLWHAKLPDVAGGNWRFRELFVNGRRRPRARHPNQGYLRVVKPLPDKRSGFTFKSGDLPNALETGGELVFLHDWSITRVPIKSADHSSNTLRTEYPIGPNAPHYKIDHFEPHPRYFVEGHRALLDQPGEWHLDLQQGELVYKPLPGERPDSLEAVAPYATALLELQGEPGRPVRNLHVDGIVFEHARWDLPAGGYAAGQATMHEKRYAGQRWGGRTFVPAAVTFELAEDCSIRRCRFRHMGTSAVWFASRTYRCRLERCLIEDTSGNGVNVAEDPSRLVGGKPWWLAAPDQAAAGHVIADNVVRRCGQQFFGAVGIWVGSARDVRIEHNEVAYHPYTGISVGWMWNPRPTPVRDIAVLYNHIHHVMQVLSDGGGIYTLGRQPGTRLAHNHIHAVPKNAGRAESNGMFLDEGTDQIVIEQNLIYDVARSPLRFHRAVENIVRNNILVLWDAKTPSIRYNATDPKTIRKIDNEIVLRSQFQLSRYSEAISAAGPRQQ